MEKYNNDYDCETPTIKSNSINNNNGIMDEIALNSSHHMLHGNATNKQQTKSSSISFVHQRGNKDKSSSISTTTSAVSKRLSSSSALITTKLLKDTSNRSSNGNDNNNDEKDDVDNLLDQLGYEEYLDEEDEDENEKEELMKEDNHDKKKTNFVVVVNHLPSPKHEAIFIILIGILLSFNAGYLNGACTSNFLFHSSNTNGSSNLAWTNVLTRLAIMAVHPDGYGDENTTNIVSLMIGMMISFIIGSFIAGCMNPSSTAMTSSYNSNNNKKKTQQHYYRIEPNYLPTLLVAFVVMLSASILAASSFDENNNNNTTQQQRNIMIVFYLIACVNGIQNVISTLYSNHLFRTTHISASFTDIGIFLGQLVRGGNICGSGHSKVHLKLVLLLSLFVAAFWSGCIVAVFATQAWMNYSLLYNVGLLFLIVVSWIIFLVYELKISIQAAVLGTWQWNDTLGSNGQLWWMIMNNSSNPVNNSDDDRLMQLLQLFDQLDAVNRTGRVHYEQLYRHMKQSGMKISRRNSIVLIKHVHAQEGRSNNSSTDGCISRDEWYQMALSFCGGGGEGGGAGGGVNSK